MKKIPDVTPLQFFILALVGVESIAGRQIRERLSANYDKRMALPTFYDLMGRLESAGLVEGWYEQRVGESYGVKERHYRITERGAAVYAETRDLFVNSPVAPGQLLPEA